MSLKSENSAGAVGTEPLLFASGSVQKRRYQSRLLGDRLYPGGCFKKAKKETQGLEIVFRGFLRPSRPARSKVRSLITIT